MYFQRFLFSLDFRWVYGQVWEKLHVQDEENFFGNGSKLFIFWSAATAGPWNLSQDASSSFFQKFFPQETPSFGETPLPPPTLKKLLFCIFIFLQRPPPHASADKLVITCKVKPLFRYHSKIHINFRIWRLLFHEGLVIIYAPPPKRDSQELKTEDIEWFRGVILSPECNKSNSFDTKCSRNAWIFFHFRK